MEVLIIEDENRAAKRIAQLIHEVAPHFIITKTIETVRDAIAFLNNNKVDLIFSDIQLADGLSFEIYKTVKVDCPIIFTTAFDQYMINAFETNGIDYLMKPIERKRLEKAIYKFEQFKNVTPIDIQSLFNSIQLKDQYKNRFMIKVGDKIKTIPTDTINAIYSERKGTYILTNQGRNYVLDYSLEEVFKLLDPQQFFKISRKVIANINAIEEIIAHSNSRLKLKIPYLELDEVIVAREKVNDFKIWIGG